MTGMTVRFVEVEQIDLANQKTLRSFRRRVFVLVFREAIRSFKHLYDSRGWDAIHRPESIGDRGILSSVLWVTVPINVNLGRVYNDDPTETSSTGFVLASNSVSRFVPSNSRNHSDVQTS